MMRQPPSEGVFLTLFTTGRVYNAFYGDKVLTP